MDNTEESTQIVDGEIMSSDSIGMSDDVTATSTEASPSSPSGQATVTLNLESLIKGHITTIERLQNDIREQKEMLDNVLASDMTYQQHVEEAKKASKVKSQTLQEIMKRPDVAQVANKIKSFRADLAEQMTTLSELLTEFQRVSGMNEIEDDKGEIREIVTNAKLVKRGSR